MLDDIYNSTDPSVKRYTFQILEEEMDRAHERTAIRVAQKFSHLLSPRMRQALASYPAVERVPLSA